MIINSIINIFFLIIGYYLGSQLNKSIKDKSKEETILKVEIVNQEKSEKVKGFKQSENEKTFLKEKRINLS